MPTPSSLTLKKRSKCLHITFEGVSFELSFEMLRVFSPSAEVRGHGIDQGVLQAGKKHVIITALEPVGHYGVKLIFDDGHDSGIYTWDYLEKLGTQADTLWADYLNQLQAQGLSRDPNVQILKL